MHILLAAVNAKYIHSNLAVHSLKAYAGQYTKGICTAEYTINQSADEILADLYMRRPDVVCFSCYLWNIVCVRQIAAELPKILPGVSVWFGGPEVSFNAPAVLAECPQIDGVMCGEGEETFSELAKLWTQTKPDGWQDRYREIKGIVFRGRGGTAEATGPRPAVDLNRIPFVYRDMEDFRNRIVYYESSRGCPFSCSYCLSSIDKCLRFRDLSLVQKELQFFIDHEVPQVKFVDRTFNCRTSHAVEIWKYIKEHDRGVTNFHFEIAADLLDEEELLLMRDMRPGLIQLEIGVQSANSRTIREIQRKMDLEKVRAAVGRVRERRNIHQHLDLIAGLPFENFESFSCSFNCVYAMKPDQLQLGFLKVLKGSLMQEKAEEYGLLYQERPPYEVLATKWMSYGELIRLKQIEEMVEVYYNSGQFCNTMECLEKWFPSPFEMYAALAAFYEEKALFKVSHSRQARYEILSDFIKNTLRRILAGQPEEAGCAEEELREWLTLDLYLRDNVKNRPKFLGESSVDSDEAARFYRKEEEERIYLKNYEGFDRRQMRKMTHLERIRGKLLLFDYRRRDPLSGNAAVLEIF